MKCFQTSLILQQLYKPGEFFLKRKHSSSHSSFTDSPPSHYEVGSCVWRQWQILGPAFHSSCMQCSRWGHLIRLTSAGAPCTDVPLGIEENRSSCSSHCHDTYSLQFISGLSFLLFFFLFPLLLREGYCFFLSSQTTLMRAQASPLENFDYYPFAVIINVFE